MDGDGEGGDGGGGGGGGGGDGGGSTSLDSGLVGARECGTASTMLDGNPYDEETMRELLERDQLGSPSGRRLMVFSEMARRHAEFTDRLPLRIFCGTWNVNGKSPPLPLDGWLPSDVPEEYDICCLALQEVQPLTGMNAVTTDVTRGRKWKEHIEATLGGGKTYACICARQMVGILLLCFVRHEHEPAVSELMLADAGTGIMRSGGNKGGVAARFRLYDKTLSFVSCHLAAHDHNVERRNQDFHDVVRKAVFVNAATGLPPSQQPTQQPAAVRSSSNEPYVSPSPSAYSWPVLPAAGGYGAGVPAGLGAAAAASDSDKGGGGGVGGGNGSNSSGWMSSTGAFGRAGGGSADQGAPSVTGADGAVSSGARSSSIDVGVAGTDTGAPSALSVLDHDVVFWLGDLNYRIALPPERVLELIECRAWGELAEFDQLNSERAGGAVLQGFEEGALTFAPTYKHEPHGVGYGRAPDENGTLVVKRTPSWCDRVLWRNRVSASAESVALQFYRRHEVLASDHRPVSATFAVGFERVDRKRRSEVRRAVQRGLDAREAELAPRIRTSPASLALGPVAFASPSEALPLVLTNEGLLPTVVRLCSSRLAPWLRVYPPGVAVPSGGGGDGGDGSGGDDGGDDSRVVRGGSDEDMQVTLAAGEAVTLHVAAIVDRDCGWAAALSAGEVPLNGRLVFVSADALPSRRQPFARPKPITLARVAIAGEYAATALGSTLSLLSGNTSNYVDAAGGPDGLHSSGPFGRRRSSGWDRSSGSDGGGATLMGPAATDGKRYPLPPQLWHLVDALLPAVAPGDASLFLRDGGEPAAVAAVLAATDRGEYATLATAPPAALASALLRLLASLHEPVVPYSCYDRAVAAGAARSPAAARGVVATMPPVHANTLTYVLGLLRRLAGLEGGDGAAAAAAAEPTADVEGTADALAERFGAVLLWPLPRGVRRALFPTPDADGGAKPFALASPADWRRPAAASPFHGDAADGGGGAGDDDPAAAAGRSAAADRRRRGGVGDLATADAAERVAFVRMLLDSIADPDLTVVW